MTRILQAAFFLFIVRPVLTIMLGTNVRRRTLLPQKGPAIIVANHNSHLDTLTIMALYPACSLGALRPVAAMDYFLSTATLAWFATNIIGIIPIPRGGGGQKNPLQGCLDALDRGEILVLFPEGTRGQPEQPSQFKKGVAHIVKARPDVPVHPLFICGLGKALPKDSWLLVPFNCDIAVGEPIRWNGSTDDFMVLLQQRMSVLSHELYLPAWE